MIVLIDNHAGGFEPRTVHWWDRVAARAHAEHLDRALAAGASPDASTGLALQAQRLVDPWSRRQLAATLEAVTDRAGRPPLMRSWRAPQAAGAIRAAAPELLALSARLRAPTVVSAEGVAQVEALLTDGTGPLYRPGPSSALEGRARQARLALEPV
jgi:hypothetical protein